MDEYARQPISTFEPEQGDDESPSIPRVQVNGWVKATYWNGRVKLVKVRTVRVFEDVMAEQLYPPTRKGYPVFLDMFPRGRLEMIPEDEAHDWLRAHGLPVPGENGVEHQ